MIWNPNPVAFEFFGISIAWYGISWSLAIVLGYFVMLYIFKRDRKDINKLLPFIQYIFVVSLIGARLFEMLFYQTELFFSNPLSFFYFRDGGLASHGTILGTVIVIYLFSRKHKDLSISYLMDRSIIAATLQGAIVRIGNFMNSELYGTPSDLPWAVQFSQVDSLFRHPVQIYEAFWLFFCFLLFFTLYIKNKAKKPFTLTSIFFIVVFSGRVVLEFFKEDNLFFLIFIKSQLISLIALLLGLILFIFSQRQKNY